MAHYKGAASEAGRAMALMKKREIQQQETELRKKKIEDVTGKVSNMDKFASHIGNLIYVDAIQSLNIHLILRMIKIQ